MLRLRQSGFLVIAMVGSATYAQEIETGEERIARAWANLDSEKVEIIYRIADLPNDISGIVTVRGLVPLDLMADWGEAWNESDIGRVGDRTSQHVFSVVSPSVAGIVYRAGAGNTTFVVVLQRNVPGFCRFRLDDIPRNWGVIAQIAREPNRWPDLQCEYHE